MTLAHRNDRERTLKENRKVRFGFWGTVKETYRRFYVRRKERDLCGCCGVEKREKLLAIAEM